MGYTEELKVFLSYSEYRLEIVDFLEQQIKRIPRKETLIEVDTGLFSITRQLSFENFNEIKVIESNPWLKIGLLNDALYLNGKRLKVKSSFDVDNEEWWTSGELLNILTKMGESNRSIISIKKDLIRLVNIKKEIELDVIANILKNTYNVVKSPHLMVSEVYILGDKSHYLKNLMVGDIVVLPLITKNNAKIHNEALSAMRSGASILILEPVSRNNKNLDNNAQVVFEGASIPFRVVYYSMF